MLQISRDTKYETVKNWVNVETETHLWISERNHVKPDAAVQQQHRQIKYSRETERKTEFQLMKPHF